MPALSEYINVHATANALLLEKGFQVWKTEAGDYWAEKDGWDFMADNPISLLGLISIFERASPSECRDYWWRSATQVPSSDLPKTPAPYVSVINRARDEG